MNPLAKAKYHIKDLIQIRDKDFVAWKFLQILNRRIKLPSSLFFESYLKHQISKEKHLIPFMKPRNGSIYVDIGANKGIWIRRMKKHYQVIGFEPDPREYRYLKAYYGTAKNVMLFNIALGEKEEIKPFLLHKFSGVNSFVIQKESFIKKINVLVRPLDAFMFEDIGLIKIDTEGFEIPILKGAVNTLNRCKPRLIIEAHLPYREQEARICYLLDIFCYNWGQKNIYLG